MEHPRCSCTSCSVTMPRVRLSIRFSKAATKAAFSCHETWLRDRICIPLSSSRPHFPPGCIRRLCAARVRPLARQARWRFHRRAHCRRAQRVSIERKTLCKKKMHALVVGSLDMQVICCFRHLLRQPHKTRDMLVATLLIEMQQPVYTLQMSRLPRRVFEEYP
jgi:hypothetical protein